MNAKIKAGKCSGTDNTLRHYLTKLTETLHQTHCNIICDDWFVQVKLVQDMKKTSD